METVTETTRHFTATVYVVNDGATALHEHPRLGIRIPPGGHVGRDELPHETARREVREETGLDATILDERDASESRAESGTTSESDAETSITAPAGRELPRPRHQMLYDVDVLDGEVVHQHIDHVYYATVPSRDVTPQDGEAAADTWEWFTAPDLRASNLEPDVVALGIEAIEVASRSP